MRKKGFTLVELLAAIVLLGIIIAIAVPKYNKYIAKSKKNTFRETLSGLYRSVEIYVAEHPEKSFNEYTNISSINIDAENLNKLESGRFIVENGVLYLEDISNGDFCGRGHKDNFEIIEGACS